MLTDQAMLVRLSISQMGLSHKDHKATRTANQALSTGTKQAGYFRKFKVQPSDVKAITHVAGIARADHRRMTTPFGDDNWRLLNSSLVMKYTNTMRGHKQNFHDAVNDFINNWQAIIARNQIVLGNIFNIDDYPSEGKLTNFYKFKTELRPVPQSDHLVLQIEKETLDNLRDELKKQNTKNLEQAKKDLWSRLYQPVKHMAEKLSESKPRIYETMIGNIEAIIDLLPHLNVSGDPALTRMANEIRIKLCGFTTGQLRDDPHARHITANEASHLVSKMDHFMGVANDKQP